MRNLEVFRFWNDVFELNVMKLVLTGLGTLKYLLKLSCRHWLNAWPKQSQFEHLFVLRFLFMERTGF